jgi:hypothetical protein
MAGAFPVVADKQHNVCGFPLPRTMEIKHNLFIGLEPDNGDVSLVLIVTG